MPLALFVTAMIILIGLALVAPRPLAMRFLKKISVPTFLIGWFILPMLVKLDQDGLFPAPVSDVLDHWRWIAIASLLPGALYIAAALIIDFADWWFGVPGALAKEIKQDEHPESSQFHPATNNWVWVRELTSMSFPFQLLALFAGFTASTVMGQNWPAIVGIATFVLIPSLRKWFLLSTGHAHILTKTDDDREGTTRFGNGDKCP